MPRLKSSVLAGDDSHRIRMRRYLKNFHNKQKLENEGTREGKRPLAAHRFERSIQ